MALPAFIFRISVLENLYIKEVEKTWKRTRVFWSFLQAR